MVYLILGNTQPLMLIIPDLLCWRPAATTMSVQYCLACGLYKLESLGCRSDVEAPVLRSERSWHIIFDQRLLREYGSFVESASAIFGQLDATNLLKCRVASRFVVLHILDSFKHFLVRYQYTNLPPLPRHRESALPTCDDNQSIQNQTMRTRVSTLFGQGMRTAPPFHLLACLLIKHCQCHVSS